MMITIKLAIILLLIIILTLSYRSKSATATKILIVYSVRRKLRNTFCQKRCTLCMLWLQISNGTKLMNFPFFPFKISCPFLIVPLCVLQLENKLHGHYLLCIVHTLFLAASFFYDNHKTPALFSTWVWTSDKQWAGPNLALLYFHFTFYFLFLLFSMEPSHHSLITTTQNIISFNIYVMILWFIYLLCIRKEICLLLSCTHFHYLLYSPYIFMWDMQLLYWVGVLSWGKQQDTKTISFFLWYVKTIAASPSIFFFLYIFLLLHLIQSLLHSLPLLPTVHDYWNQLMVQNHPRMSFSFFARFWLWFWLMVWESTDLLQYEE